ncbi:MAG: hypothetical protein DMG88_24180, partial [Acidobacteria bacterium]
MKKLTMTRLLELTSLIMCMWVLALPVLAQEFRFVSFDFPGCDLSGPNGVNARGQVVGRCVDAKGVHGFLY